LLPPLHSCHHHPALHYRTSLLDSPRTLGHYGTTPALTWICYPPCNLELLFPYYWKPGLLNIVINLLNILWLGVLVCIWVLIQLNHN
ncbi:hypothetical protein J4Q44_G00376140, partial [Coregonus suidteri]